MATNLPLTLRVRRIWPFLALWLLGCVLVFQYMTIQRNHLSHDFTPLVKGDLVAYGKVLLYYLPVEIISIIIIIKVLQLYRYWLKLDSLTLTPGHLMRYEAAFLPAILIAIPLFCPITNTLRYGLLFSVQQGWDNYFPSYFFTWRMFINYLLPVLVFSYGYINVNLMLDYFDWHRLETENAIPQPIEVSSPSQAEDFVASNGVEQVVEESSSDAEAIPAVEFHSGDETRPVDEITFPSKAYLLALDASDALGQTCLVVDAIWYFQVEGKNCVAFTATCKYRVRKTLVELEAELNPQSFFRLSRSVIINLSFVLNYSHWEYDKYIVRLIDEKAEFIMQRSRLKGLRQGLKRESRQ